MRPSVTLRPQTRPATRAEPRDVIELKSLRASMPELATAVDLQLAQLELFRRVQARVPLPAQIDLARAAADVKAGRPILRFPDLPLNWSDFRWGLRETADLLRRFDLVDAGLQARVHHLMREAHTLEPVVERWFSAAVTSQPVDDEEIGEVFARALKPFAARAAEVWGPRLDVSTWQRGVCPLCGAPPELGILLPDGDRLLVCERCTSRWPSPPERCPWCGEDRVDRRTTLGTPDGRYQLSGCDSCRRYLKSCDERHLGRPTLPWVDSVATMPLDAAAMQRGYGA
jgi:FdhE protein